MLGSCMHMMVHRVHEGLLAGSASDVRLSRECALSGM